MEMGIKRQHSTLSVDKMSDAAPAISTAPAPGPTLPRKGSTRDILLPVGGPDSVDAIEEEKVSSPSELKEQFARFQGAEGSSVSGDFHALSITKQRLDEERRKREEQERAEAEEAARIAAEEEEAAAAALAEAKGGSTSGGSFRLKTRLGSSVRQLKWKGSSSTLESKNVESEENKNSAAMINAHSDSVEVSVDGVGNFPDHPPPEGIRAVGSTLENNSGIEEALFVPGQSNDAKVAAKIHLGGVAADYLEKLCRELLKTDAPLLLEEIKAACAESSSPDTIESKLTDLWVNTLMTLATRCCATVEPDVKNGDLLDIRPYCKVKCIPGGSVTDSAYMSGIVFHKNVSHKKMARVISNARIMVLNGGIEYTRTENRIASLDTLLEQEERYMEILVTKIFKLKPNILICSKSVCRKAQELLLRANVVLIQYAKLTLMDRIARQTGATVLSSIDHVINSTILGEMAPLELCRLVIVKAISNPVQSSFLLLS